MPQTAFGAFMLLPYTEAAVAGVEGEARYSAGWRRFREVGPRDRGTLDDLARKGVHAKMLNPVIGSLRKKSRESAHAETLRRVATMKVIDAAREYAMAAAPECAPPRPHTHPMSGCLRESPGFKLLLAERRAAHGAQQPAHLATKLLAETWRGLTDEGRAAYAEQARAANAELGSRRAVRAPPIPSGFGAFLVRESTQEALDAVDQAGGARQERRTAQAWAMYQALDAKERADCWATAEKMLPGQPIATSRLLRTANAFEIALPVSSGDKPALF